MSMDEALNRCQLRWHMNLATEDEATLHRILDCLPTRTWSWTFLQYWGTGAPPDGYQSMEAFESAVRGLPVGLMWSGSDLLDFAASVEQTIDCLIVASDGRSKLTRDSVASQDYPFGVVTIEARDSTEWIVTLNGAVSLDPLAERCLQRLAGLDSRS